MVVGLLEGGCRAVAIDSGTHCAQGLRHSVGTWIQILTGRLGAGVVLSVVSSTALVGVGLLHRFGVGGVVCQCPGLEYMYG